MAFARLRFGLFLLTAEFHSCVILYVPHSRTHTFQKHLIIRILLKQF